MGIGDILRTVLTVAFAIVFTDIAVGQTLRVFAAASLTESFLEIGKVFEASNPGVTVEFNFAGSQVLRTQIEHGAEADVLASADRIHAEALQARDLLGEVTVFATNALIVVIPTEKARVRSLLDLARPKVKIVVAGPSIPVGRYTTQTLRLLAGSGLYGDDYQTRVQANIVSRESNVRAVLAKVVFGEADAGFVYRTDALTAKNKVHTLVIPDRLNVIAEYPIGILRQSDSPVLAREFVAFVTGAEGQAVLAKYGFMPAP